MVTMAGKRKSTMRRQSDGPPRKKSTTAVDDERLSTPRAPTTVEAPLPSRISSTRPLPTLRDVSRVPSEALQSIAQSGVLAASVDRSRAQWLSEGLFEKYWMKPTKKKGQSEPANNPGRETMQRLGPCRMFVDPHTFDAILYTIREASTVAKVPKQAKAQQAIFTASNLQSSQYGAGLSNQASSGVSNPPQPANSTSSATQPKSAQDPVIQMLAQRASKDPQLNNLMQVVATGRATPDQLHIFQTHINQLNVVLQQQPKNPSPNPSSASVNTSKQPLKSSTPSIAPAASSQFPAPKAFTPAPPPAPAPITGIAIEFTSGNGDRFLLPRMSIFEYDVPRRQVILSFLIIRKGSEIPLSSATDDSVVPSSAHYDPTKEYHQPVTIRLASDQPRIWESLVKCLPSIQEVQRYMEDVMSRTERANTSELALRLPFKGLDLSDESSVPSTPVGKMPTAGKGADRKQSLIKQAAAGAMAAASPSRASPASSGVREERNRFEELHCLYCFEEVYAPVQKLEGKTVCHACAVLRRKAMKGMPVRRPDTGVRVNVTARALVL